MIKELKTTVITQSRGYTPIYDVKGDIPAKPTMHIPDNHCQLEVELHIEFSGDDGGKIQDLVKAVHAIVKAAEEARRTTDVAVVQNAVDALIEKGLVEACGKDEKGRILYRAAHPTADGT